MSLIFDYVKCQKCGTMSKVAVDSNLERPTFMCSYCQKVQAYQASKNILPSELLNKPNIKK